MQLLASDTWTDYELIDSGGFRKLERFGRYVLIRPEPQALWNRALPDDQWHKLSHAEFSIDRNDPEKGKWLLKPGMPEQWQIGYRHQGLQINFRLGLTAFRHIGVFPEQSANWDYIFSFISSVQTKSPRVLNLFAYTGGASLAARAAGADITHVDSVKPVINWARDNMDRSGLNNIRWVVEDAMKFIRREARRGSIYQGIILDPPAYGRGPEGEKWVLEDGINEMVSLCSSLLAPENSFLILNMYSIGFSALVAENLVNGYFNTPAGLESGELYIPEKQGRRLPLGTFVRFSR